MRFLGDFAHSGGTNVALQLANFLSEDGYEVKFHSDYWPVVATHKKRKHSVAIRETDNVILKSEILHLQSEAAATKIIITNFGASELGPLELWVTAATSFGIGIYSPEFGWVNPPHSTSAVDFTELTMRMLPQYIRAGDGTWEKVCRDCGEIQPLSNFYRVPRSHSRRRDPLRNTCKDCFRRGT